MAAPTEWLDLLMAHGNATVQISGIALYPIPITHASISRRRCLNMAKWMSESNKSYKHNFVKSMAAGQYKGVPTAARDSRRERRRRNRREMKKALATK